MDTGVCTQSGMCLCMSTCTWSALYSVGTVSSLFLASPILHFGFPPAGASSSLQHRFSDSSAQTCGVPGTAPNCPALGLPHTDLPPTLGPHSQLAPPSSLCSQVMWTCDVLLFPAPSPVSVVLKSCCACWFQSICTLGQNHLWWFHCIR